MAKKKAQAMSTLAALGVGIATLVITLTVTFLIIAEGQTSLRDTESRPNMQAINGTHGFNATVELQNAVGDIPGWVPLIVITVIGSVLLGLISLFRRTA